ncbi:MAG: class I SAM-dependent RNA methyltransferase [Clostridia bacterium]|nr:class I SAM-dependent RNA methyltransferase [Clostridia bacterium]
MTYRYVATCLFGLEKYLGEEIDGLGYKRTETMDGRVIFEGDAAAAARANVFLRTAERVFLLLGEFGAASFTELFDGTKALPWSDLVGKDDAFPVKGHSIKSRLTSIPDCQKIVKKAIVDNLSSKYGITVFPETGTKYQIEFFILRDRAMLMIDLSGTALHKRGYRPETYEAPIRETLAAGMVRISRPREDVLFWDPMCGSGTIAIEAAMLQNRIAPGKNRSFAAEAFPAFDKSIWTAAREEAEDNELDTAFEVFASDISDDAVRQTLDNVKRAGVEKTVKVFRRDALTVSTEGRRGTIVTNPPYGERMFSVKDTEILYRRMGEHFRTLDRWQIYIITSHPDFERLYGRKADAKRRLYNGMIECCLYQYFKPQNGQER